MPGTPKEQDPEQEIENPLAFTVWLARPYRDRVELDQGFCMGEMAVWKRDIRCEKQALCVSPEEYVQVWHTEEFWFRKVDKNGLWGAELYKRCYDGRSGEFSLAQNGTRIPYAVYLLKQPYARLATVMLEARFRAATYQEDANDAKGQALIARLCDQSAMDQFVLEGRILQFLPNKTHGRMYRLAAASPEGFACVNFRTHEFRQIGLDGRQGDVVFHDYQTLHSPLYCIVGPGRDANYPDLPFIPLRYLSEDVYESLKTLWKNSAGSMYALSE
jgi:hypothetical protein